MVGIKPVMVSIAGVIKLINGWNWNNLGAWAMPQSHNPAINQSHNNTIAGVA